MRMGTADQEEPALTPVRMSNPVVCAAVEPLVRDDLQQARREVLPCK